MVWCLTLAYRGTDYAGWQRQSNAMTVQERLEQALEKVAGQAVRTVGAGRTDAGVHARGQVAHLRTPDGQTPDGATGSDWTRLPDKAFVHGTNRHLPPDIRVLGARRMPDGFDARKSAVSKRYSYRTVLTETLSPLDSLFAVRLDPGVDVGAMREAAAACVGEHDFSAFALAGGAHTDPRRRIFSVDLERAGAELVFGFEGEGFLRGMVRSLVGTLFEVGAGKRSPADFGRLLEGGSRSLAGPTAPPEGLVLESVSYGPEGRDKPLTVLD